MDLLLFFWVVPLLGWLFVLGTAVGSFLNVCIVRLPRGRSLLWPGSRCGGCYRPVRLQHNIPLVSYWWLSGRCRDCGGSFSMRYFWVEFLTGAIFIILYLLEVAADIHRFRPWGHGAFYGPASNLYPPHFLLAVLLACLLIAAAGCLLKQGRVPRALTVTGVLLGLLGVVVFPCSWVNDPSQGFYAWPSCQLVLDWLPPGSRRLGLAIGVAGLLAVWPLRLATAAASKVLARDVRDQAGEGLLMIAGCFLGWQPILLALILAPVLALGAGVLCRGAHPSRLPLGFWMSVSVVLVWMGWSWLTPVLRPVLSHPLGCLFIVLAGPGLVFLSTVLSQPAAVSGQRSAVSGQRSAINSP
jgi:leader peptidase (prepilin peptidase)/N-methyltransferase